MANSETDSAPEGRIWIKNFLSVAEKFPFAAPKKTELISQKWKQVVGRLLVERD